MLKIAALYICTGKYDVFWPGFYASAEKYLLKDCEVHYFVFTDRDFVEGEDTNPRVHRCEQEAYSWPFATLRRFEIFLNREEELKQFDYVFFFNANAQIMCPITREMFLPRAERKEELLFVQHPAFYNLPNYEFTYDRNIHSTAFIPMGMGEYYVCGGINGGQTAAFLKMCHTLARNIQKDLKKNVIALWHDESHINHYILTHKNVRILNPSYCWPEGWNLPFPCVILIRDKAKYLNIQALRDNSPQTQLSPRAEKINAFMKRVVRKWARIKDNQ